MAERFADNPINQTLLSTFMRKKNIKFDIAKNGEEAVEKWRTGGFHLILVGRIPAAQEQHFLTDGSQLL